MLQDSAELNALIGSRICHDLISPIGAIGNGLELLQMSIPPSPELSLISESVENAIARVRFFRIAFGRAGGGKRMSISEIDTILRDFSKGGRTEFRFGGDAAPDRAELRAAFLGALCLESDLPFGGQIALEYQGDAWELRAIGERRAQQAPWNLLSDAPATQEVSPAEVQFLLFPQSLRQLGKTVEVAQNATSTTLRF